MQEEQVGVAVVVRDSGGRDGTDPWSVAIIKAIIAVLLVAAVVGAALGAATYVVAHQLVRLMS